MIPCSSAAANKGPTGDDNSMTLCPLFISMVVADMCERLPHLRAITYVMSLRFHGMSRRRRISHLNEAHMQRMTTTVGLMILLCCAGELARLCV